MPKDHASLPDPVSEQAARQARHAAARAEVEAYRPPDAEQSRLRQAILAHLSAHPDALERTCQPGHLTASALVIDRTCERALLLNHAKLGRWLQPGGHIEGDASLGLAALREVREETGLRALALHPEVIDLDIHRIPARLRSHGAVEAEHLHLDVRFLVFALSPEPLVESDESRGLAWFSQQALEQLATDASVRRLFERSRAVQTLFLTP
jgi:8-oxo-dGTP pyrophosphatase MutT (NUDIX family)